MVFGGSRLKPQNGSLGEVRGSLMRVIQWAVLMKSDSVDSSCRTVPGVMRAARNIPGTSSVLFLTPCLRELRGKSLLLRMSFENEPITTTRNRSTKAGDVPLGIISQGFGDLIGCQPPTDSYEEPGN